MAKSKKKINRGRLKFLYSKGYNICELAKMFGVTRQAISLITSNYDDKTKDSNRILILRKRLKKAITEPTKDRVRSVPDIIDELESLESTPKAP